MIDASKAASRSEDATELSTARSPSGCSRLAMASVRFVERPAPEAEALEQRSGDGSSGCLSAEGQLWSKVGSG